MHCLGYLNWYLDDLRIYRIHGIKSGKLLKEFHGHSSFINDVLFSPDGAHVVSGSSDGSLRVLLISSLLVGKVLITFLDLGHQDG